MKHRLYNYIAKQIDVYVLLKKHINLTYKRTSVQQQSTFIKAIIILFKLFLVTSFSFIGIEVATIFTHNQIPNSELRLLYLIPIVFVINFFSYFLLKESITIQAIKPYLLLYIKQNTLINALLLKGIFHYRNFPWHIFIVTSLVYIGIKNTSLSPLNVFLIIICFTLTLQISYLFYKCISLLFARYPFCYILLFFSVSIILGLKVLYIEKKLFFYFNIIGSYPFLPNNIICLILTQTSVIVFLFFLLRTLLKQELRKDLEGNFSVPINFLPPSSWLKIKNIFGYFLKLEFYNIIRNKQSRKHFIMACLSTIMFSMNYAYIPANSIAYSENLSVFFALSCISSLLLIRIMTVEGNYISILMSKKETLYSLLQAKYQFFLILSCIPIFIMLPSLVKEYNKLLTILSYWLFTVGGMNFLLFQMAVYNKKTAPLHKNIASHKNPYNSPLQIIVGIISLFSPILFIHIINKFIPSFYASTLLACIGLFFIISHKWWIKNIYNRIMAKRYTLIEGYIQSK